MSKNSKVIYFLTAILFFVLSDLYLTENILQNKYNIQDNPIFNFVFVENTGAAFNIFEGFKIFLITFSLGAMILILVHAFKHIRDFNCKHLFLNAMLVAGIFCNMLERIYHGCVRDYIKLNFINFPIFNISDVLINISVFLIVILIIKNKYINNNDNSCR